MKILLITNKVPYPDNDGGTIACLNMAKGFFALENEVTILAMTTLKHKVTPGQIPDHINKTARFIFVNVPAPLTVSGALKNFLFSSLPYNAERFIDRRFEARLSELLWVEKFDIIQLEGLYVCPYIKTIRKFSDAKIVYRAHNIEAEIWERSLRMAKGFKNLYLRILHRRLKKFETSFLNQYDILVPITSRDAGIFQKLGNHRPVFVSQTGFDTTKTTPDPSLTEYPSVFHIGALDWAPNQEGLIWFIDNCWKILSKKYPSLKFYIAGRNAPDWLIRKIQVQNAEFLGEINDAHEFINSKAIMVVPLFSGSGMRIKIIEGMALGKAIVATAIGTEGIPTTHNENILVADSAADFISAVGRLAENKELYQKIGSNAIRYIHANFDNTVLATKLVEFYKTQV